jgi:conjugal transfer ATP-binding protein TraC
MRSDRLAALFSRESLSSYLLYEAYDPDSGIFALEDRLGVVFECLPKTGVGQETLQVLEALYAATFLPAGTAIQIMLYASPNVASHLEAWYQARATGELFRKMAERRLAMLKGDLSGISAAPLRDFRLIISVTAPPSQDIDTTKEISAKVEGLLESMHLFPRKLSGNGLIALLFELLNPGHPPEATPSWNASLPIREQVIFADSPLEIKPDRLNLDRHQIKSLSVKQYPEEPITPDRTNHLIGDPLKGIDQIPIPFLYVLNVILLDWDRSVKSVETKASLVTYQSLGFLARLLPKIQEKKNNFDLLLKGIADGGRLVKAYFNVLLYGREEDPLERITQQVSGLFRKQGFILQEDYLIHLPMLLSSLPMGLNPEEEKRLLKRARTMLSSNAASLAPICADWKGTGSPTINLVSRRGQLMLVDPFDSPGNFNLVTAGAPGNGKSGMGQEICYSHRSMGERSWVIDRGRSYLKLCDHMGGEFIEFKPERSPCLNPFSRVKSLDGEESDMDLLVPILGQMASPSRPVSDLERAFLEQAIRRAYEKRKSSSTITTVAEELADTDDPRARDLSTMLYPYTRNGRYARFFEGEATLQSDNLFVVLELEELQNKPDLKGVVLLLLIYHIQSEMFLGSRFQKKLLVIDEAWDLLGEGNTAKFMERCARLLRKYRGGLHVITQGIGDLARTEAGMAVLANSDHLFLLRQKPESLLRLKESNLILMHDPLFELLSSVHTVPGHYAEIYVRTPTGSGIGRLMLDRFTQMVYTSRAEEVAQIEAYRKKGLPLVEAIERCLAA